MTHNPYQSSQSPVGPSYGGGDSPAHAQSAVSGPAIGLMVVAGISIACLCLTIPFDIYLLASGTAEKLDRGGAINPVFSIMIRTLWSFLILGASGFAFWGGFQMRQLRSYGMARTACIVASIPCLGPCCILGIPFGIWALTVLAKPEVKSAFTS